MYVWYSLRQFASPEAKVRLGKSPMLARYKSRMGFICGKFEADFWYYELLDQPQPRTPNPNLNPNPHPNTAPNPNPNP